jgi:GT2 family glycosyltransferase
MNSPIVTNQHKVVGILILNQNGQGWLPVIYNSIRAQGYPRVRVYLVDNASKDRSVELTLQKYPEVTVIHLPQNLGYCMAYNLAMPYAFADGCDWVVWANNDIRLVPGCLNELVRVVESAPKIGVVGPAFLEWDKDEPNYYILGNHPNAVPAMKGLGSQPMDVDWVEGSFLMVNRNCVEAVGPLDPYLFFYWEETDFCRRARYRGWRVVLAPSALARHYAGGWSQGNYQNTLKRNWLQTRNYYIYHLANPFQGFSRNMLDTAHLFGVRTKEHLNNHSRASMLFETRALLSILRNLRTVFLKWRRDRAGGKPPLTTPDLESLKPGIFRSYSRYDGRDRFSLNTMRAT